MWTNQELETFLSWKDNYILDYGTQRKVTPQHGQYLHYLVQGFAYQHKLIKNIFGQGNFLTKGQLIRYYKDVTTFSIQKATLTLIANIIESHLNFPIDKEWFTNANSRKHLPQDTFQLGHIYFDYKDQKVYTHNKENYNETTYGEALNICQKINQVINELFNHKKTNGSYIEYDPKLANKITQVANHFAKELNLTERYYHDQKHGINFTLDTSSNLKPLNMEDIKSFNDKMKRFTNEE